MLIDRIKEDLKEAMKARDAHRVDTLRFLLSEVKNVGINEKKDLTDAVFVGVVQRLSKQRRDGIEQFRTAGRTDLVDKEEAELAILQGYLPKQMTDAELEAVVRTAIQETGATSKKDMGKVMKLAMERLAGAAEGKRVQTVVQSLLP